MLLPSYTTSSVAPQAATSQSWWTGLFSLGQEAIRRALPLPGETVGGVAGVPLRPVSLAATQPQAIAGISNTLLIGAAIVLGAAFVLPRFLRK
jgi:hypothetical protein